MTTDILSNINFIDAVMGLIIIRCIYSGATAGLVIEFFKLLGTIFATFITLHYFTAFAEFLTRMVSFPSNVAELIAFVVLWMIVVLIFKVVRDGWMLLIKTEAQESFNKAGGALTGIFRGVLVVGLTTLLLLLAGNKYLIKSIKTSFSGMYLSHFSISVYESCYDNFVNKFFPKEKKNFDALKITSRGSKKKE